MAQREIEKHIKALKDDDWEVRERAAEALGMIGPDAREAVPALIKTLDAIKLSDYDPDVVAAVKALGKIGGQSALATLIKVLNYHDVSSEAAEGLGIIGDPKAVSGLLKTAKTDKGFARYTAVEALIKIGEPAIPALIEVLKVGDWDLRGRTAEALGEIGDKTAIPALTEALKDKDKSVRDAAAEALKKLEGKKA